jgi:hypothetical protein
VVSALVPEGKALQSEGKISIRDFLAGNLLIVAAAG